MPEQASPLERSTEVLGGVVVFRGTRVPVQALIDYLAADERVSDFLADFPTVTKAQVAAACELVRETLRTHTPR